MTFKQEVIEQWASLNQKVVKTSDLQTKGNWTTGFSQPKAVETSDLQTNLLHTIKKLLNQAIFKQEAIEQMATHNHKRPSNKRQLNKWLHTIKRLLKQATFKQEAIEQVASLNQNAIKQVTFKQEAIEQVASINQNAV